MGAIMDLEQIGYFLFMEEQERQDIEHKENTEDREEQGA